MGTTRNFRAVNRELAVLRAAADPEHAAREKLSNELTPSELHTMWESLSQEERASLIELLSRKALEAGELEDGLYLHFAAVRAKLGELARKLESDIVEQFGADGMTLAWPGVCNKELPRFDRVAIARNGAVWRIVVFRPPMNILDTKTATELTEAMEFAIDNTPANKLPIVVLSSVGPGTFSAGGDITEHEPEKLAKMLDAIHGMFRLLVSRDLLTVAKLRGKVFGAAVELAALSDFAIAEQGTVLCHPEVKLACFPSVAVALYPLMLEDKMLKKIVFGGYQLGAEEAKSLMLLTDVVEYHELTQRVNDLVANLAKQSPIVTKLALKAMEGPRHQKREDFLAALARSEDVYLNDLANTVDLREGILAWRERRAPRFIGA